MYEGEGKGWDQNGMRHSQGSVPLSCSISACPLTTYMTSNYIPGLLASTTQVLSFICIAVIIDLEALSDIGRIAESAGGFLCSIHCQWCILTGLTKFLLPVSYRAFRGMNDVCRYSPSNFQDSTYDSTLQIYTHLKRPRLLVMFLPIPDIIVLQI